MSMLKKNELYVYELSAPVLRSLNLMVFDATLKEVEPPLRAENDETESAYSSSNVKNQIHSNHLHCNLCRLEFTDQNTRREHFKTTFHIFNVKRSLKGLSSVNEPEFERILQQTNEIQTDESSSGESSSNEDNGERESEDSTEENMDIILEQTLEKELEDISINSNEPSNASVISHLATRSSQIYFKSQLLSDSEVFGVYKSLFTQDSIKNPLLSIQAWNELEDQGISISAMFMMGGGHFAGAIVSHQRINVHGNTKKQDESVQEQQVNLIEHKTFHRYTTRRKQGGSQSAMDNSKGKANSAGSSLRRYNEAALRVDIHNLLKEWEPYLSKCQNIFLRSRNSQDRKLFNEIISQGKPHPRLKSFPFTTTRPSIKELKRSWCELTYMKIAPKPKPLPLAETSTTAAKASSKRAQKPKERCTKNLSAEEKHTEHLLYLLDKGRAPLIIAYLRKNGIDVNFKLSPSIHHVAAPTMLHYASQQGLKQMVIILLTTMQADPCVKNNLNRTPWDLAKTAQTRYSFQIARHLLGESFTAWDEAHVGEPLSREQVDEINKQDEDRENLAAQVAMRKELEGIKEKQKLEEEKHRSEKAAKKGLGRVLDSSSVTREQNLNSLSDEQRRRLMREQRARAAEARMAARK
ncbi:related to Protein VMS1 [Zygosaccharomyces bailii ISA1307]|nr:related to Protein VMS1 [Zygosaccharomyces bailii ISA1307]